MKSYHQYQVIIVNLDPTLGSEIKKTRPCVIISPNEMNKHLRTITIAPLTTKSRKYPTRVAINFDKKQGWAVIDQIITIDKKRIIKSLQNLSNNEILNIKEIIKKTFVD